MVALAVMQFDVTELPRAIRWDYNHEYTKGSDPQTRSSLYAQLLARFNSDAATLENLKRSASGATSVTMNQNREDNKYYGML